MIKFEWLFFEFLMIGLAVWELYSVSRDKTGEKAPTTKDNQTDAL